MELRTYQKEILESIRKNGNTLVILPTGLGKTLIAVKAIEMKLEEGGKALFLAPTKPLVEQHYSNLIGFFPSKKVVEITGALPFKKRKDLYEEADIIVATPQTIKNDILKGVLQDFSIIIFDEAHRSVGNYAYTFIAQKARETNPRALYVGLTASPGSDKEKIERILEILGTSNVEIRTEADEGVKEYVPEKRFEWIRVELPENYLKAINNLEELIEEKQASLRKMGFYTRKGKKFLLMLRERIARIQNKGLRAGAFMNYAMLFSLLHAQELLETQGFKTFRHFFERQKAKNTRSSKMLLNNPKIKEIFAMPDITHPKIIRLRELIRERIEKSIIVFVQYRDQINEIVSELKRITTAEKFVGRSEFSQKTQKEIIERFRNGEFKVLVASSVGEEGLDIPSVDCVIFYEPIPSEIRTIQRRGRAGRTRAGEVIILITEKTRDEAYYWVAVKKEGKMKDLMKARRGSRAFVSRDGKQKRMEAPVRENAEKEEGKDKKTKRKKQTLLDFMG